MYANDLVKVCLGSKAKLLSALGVEAVRPVAHNALDEGIRLADNALRDLVTGHAAQCGDLFADADGYAGQRQGAMWTKHTIVQGGCVQQKPNCGSRRGVPVLNFFANRQHGL